MQSTLSIFPGYKKVLDSTKLPFILYTNPIPDGLATVTKTDYDIPRCPNPNCAAYFNSLCQFSSHGWTCSVCGRRSNFKEGAKIPQSIRTNPSYQIVDPSVTFPVTHVIIIGSGDISPARVIMQTLPPEVPVQVFVMNAPETARKLVTCAGNSFQLKKLPAESARVPISATIPLLQTLLNVKKCCFWCRVFCSGGTLDDRSIEKLRQFDRIPIRIDYFVDSPITPSITRLRGKLPGICRVFSSFSVPSNLTNAIDLASADCVRSFGFQCKVIVKSGPHFRASCDEERAIIQVVCSSKTHVPFLITPPVKDSKLGFQSVQVISHVHVWDPPTNTLQKCTNILNNDFPVSTESNAVAQSASSSVLFDYLCRKGNLSAIEKMRNDLANLKPLFDMYGVVLSRKDPKFEVFCAEFFALCGPTTWRFVLGTFVETWNVKDSDQVAVMILKRFPNIYFSMKDGVDVLVGDPVRKFVDLCKPLPVKVQQVPFDQINNLMSK